MAYRGTVLLQMNSHGVGEVVYPTKYYNGDHLLKLDFVHDWINLLEQFQHDALVDFKGDTDFVHPETPPTKFTPLKARYCVTVMDDSTGVIDVPEWFPLAPVELRLDIIRDWTRELHDESRRVKATCPY